MPHNVQYGKSRTFGGQRPRRACRQAAALGWPGFAACHNLQGEPGSRKSVAPSLKLWTALHGLDGYLTGQSAWLVNYAERHRAGLRVGTAITEGTANFLVNRRMNKSQQMRWSRRGGDLLLQVRCAAYNGTLGFDFGQKFYPANDVSPPTAVAA